MIEAGVKINTTVTMKLKEQPNHVLKMGGNNGSKGSKEDNGSTYREEITKALREQGKQ